MSLFNLIFKLGTDNSAFNRGMTDAVARSRVASQEMAATFSTGLRTNIGNVGQLLAGYFSYGQVKHLIDTVSTIRDMSERTGVATDTLQELGYALRQSGSSAERAEKAFIKLGEARMLALANPQGRESKQLAALGISQSELQTMRDGGDLFLRLGRAIEQTKLDANSLPVVLELIGTKNAEVLPAMAAGLNEAAKQARNLGIVLSEETINDIHAIGDEIEDVVSQIQKPFAEIVLFFARAIDATIQGIRGLGAAVVNGLTVMINANPLVSKLMPKGMKDQLLAFTDEVNQEFAAGFNNFLDRHDPEKRAAAREERARAARDRRELNIGDLVAGQATGPSAAASHDKIPTDALLSAGNFLGSSPDRRAEMELRRSNEYLMRIQQLLERQSQGLDSAF